jgi:sortase A
VVRKPLGLLLVAVGAFGLCAAGANYGQAHLARSEARAAWAAIEARSAVSTVLASLDAAAGPSEKLALGAPVARITIPRIGLDEIVVEGVGDRELNAGPGHLPGSVLPGMAGNSVLSAHRDRHFSDLGNLAMGDTITTATQHKTTIWVVTGRKVVGKRARVLRSTPDATLTLTTCWPLRYFGTAPDRLIVTAKPVGSETLAVR